MAHSGHRADESVEVSRVMSDDDVNADEVTSYDPSDADKRRVVPTFRLGRRLSSARSGGSAGPGSAGPAVARSLTFRLGRRSGTDRRSTAFRLGRRSAYDAFLMNYNDDDDKMLPVGHDQGGSAASNQPGPPTDEVHLNRECVNNNEHHVRKINKGWLPETVHVHHRWPACVIYMYSNTILILV